MKLRKKALVIAALVALAVFLAWRMVRPMNIFVVSEAFERPIPTGAPAAPLATLRASECGACHGEFYDEWRTTIHSRSWTDPYFQADWRFDGAQQICRNCHTPLDRQQEQLVLGFKDREKWDPILAPNPEFDSELQHEGVTCAACHYRDGAILGPYGGAGAPHPVRKLADSNEVCVRCHVVGGERWDTFFRFPPCGTVAEIGATEAARRGPGWEAAVEGAGALGCVECHMPLVARPLVAGGAIREARRHWWRGGHDREMVRSGLDIRLERGPGTKGYDGSATLVLTNTGAGHYLPTGTPDRHLTVELRLLDRDGAVIKGVHHTLKRTILWRPFIVDLWDTRLPRGAARGFDVNFTNQEGAVAAEAVVRYHLVDEQRRARIGYQNEEPIDYEIYHERRALADLTAARDSSPPSTPRPLRNSDRYKDLRTLRVLPDYQSAAGAARP